MMGSAISCQSNVNDKKSSVFVLSSSELMLVHAIPFLLCTLFMFFGGKEFELKSKFEIRFFKTQKISRMRRGYCLSSFFQCAALNRCTYLEEKGGVLVHSISLVVYMHIERERDINRI